MGAMKMQAQEQHAGGQGSQARAAAGFHAGGGLHEGGDGGGAGAGAGHGADASDSRASFMLGMLPSLSTMPAREAVPTRVPMVSNISIMQKVMIRVMAVNQPICRNPSKVELEEGGLHHVGEGGHEGGGGEGGEGIHAQHHKLPIQ